MSNKQLSGKNILIFTGFAFAQVLLLGYLLTINFMQAVVVGLIYGIPVAFFFYLLLRSHIAQSLRMAAAMTAIGGFGMLSGCLLEIGPFGLYGLVALCQEFSISTSWFNLEWAWQRFMLTPWTFTGMVISCNAGMWLLDKPHYVFTCGRLKRIAIYMICNISMFLGMFVFERIAVSIIPFADNLSNPLIMVCLMLLGMFLGMGLGLALTIYIKKLRQEAVFSSTLAKV